MRSSRPFVAATAACYRHRRDRVLRAVLLVEGSLVLGGDACDVADVVTFGPGEAGNTNAVRALILTAATQACPPGQSMSPPTCPLDLTLVCLHVFTCDEPCELILPYPPPFAESLARTCRLQLGRP